MSDEAQEPDLLLGRTLGGKYMIETFVGGGGMGRVYRARHLGLQKTIAIKVLHTSFQTDPKFGARFQREALATTKLDHPNVLDVTDFGQDSDGTYYIAMEFLDGRSLDHFLSQSVPLERLLEILSQVCAALAVAHEHGIVHRDMKPENVMILAKKDDEGHAVDLVKVCDFGIAKLGDTRGEDEGKQKTAALTAQGTVVGTPEYMSPEQARGEKLDARTDIYAVGVMLYQAVTGEIPFTAESAVGVLMRRLTEEARRPSEIVGGVDPRVEALILKSMHRDKAQRHQTARELRSDIRSLLGLRGSMLPAGAHRAATPAESAQTMAVTTPGAVPVARAGLAPTRLGDAVPTAPSGVVPQTPIAMPKPKSSPARWFVAAGALVVVAGFGGLMLTQGASGTDVVAVGPGAALPVAAPPGAAVGLPATAAVLPSLPATQAPAPETATPQVEEEEREGPGRPRTARVRPESAAPETAAPTTSAPPPVTAAPRPQTVVPATSRPATAAAPTGPLEASVSITGLSVGGGFSSSKVRSSIERVQGRFASCYAEAARSAGRNGAGTVNVSLTLDESGHATGVGARGDPVPGLSRCVRGVAQRISTSAPDTGTVDVSFGVQFTPRR